jgi:hypothetical protein
MVAGLGNPAGAVVLFDGGVPRTISGYARANLSGGVFAMGSTADAVVSSGASSFATSDLKFSGDASGLAVNGMVQTSAASGAPVVIITRGTVICQADGNVLAGTPVIVKGGNAVSSVTTGSVANTEYAIGRALTEATSGNYCVVNLNL